MILSLSLDKFGDLNSMKVEEAIGSLKVHEMRLKERQTREEEHVLLAKIWTKSKEDDGGQSSRGTGCG